MSITKEKTGDLCWWFEDGLLTIEGEGEMPDFSCRGGIDTFPPWYKYFNKIRAVDIRDGVIKGGTLAFLSLFTVESVSFPPSLIFIQKGAFIRCRALKSIEFSSSLLVIGGNAFESCSGLTSLELPDSLRRILPSAFKYCTGLKSVKLPHSLEKIDPRSFKGCSSLEEIELPPSVQTIGNSAFSGCTSLRKVEIPPAVTEIGEEAFFKCSSLESVVIPSSVGMDVDDPMAALDSSVVVEQWLIRVKSTEDLDTTESNETAIGDEAFAECRRLREITVLSPTPPSMTTRSFRSIDKEAVLYVPHGCSDAYRTTKPWKDKFKNIRELD
jgi:hypothetical protein